MILLWDILRVLSDYIYKQGTYTIRLFDRFKVVNWGNLEYYKFIIEFILLFYKYNYNKPLNLIHGIEPDI